MPDARASRYQSFADGLISGFPLIFQRFRLGMREQPDGFIADAALIGQRGGFSWPISESDDIGDKVSEALEELRNSQYWLRPGDTVNLWAADFYRRLVQVRPGFYDAYGVSVEPADATLATIEVRAVTRDGMPHAEKLYPTQSSAEEAAEDFARQIR